MSLSVELKKSETTASFFTNLDLIEGRIHLNLASSLSVSAIVIKLEGIAKSVCYTQPHHGKSRARAPVQEIHKVLYLTDSVFPDPQLKQTSSASSFTLQEGKHSWPFSFQIPINNDCKQASRSQGQNALGALLNGQSPMSSYDQQVDSYQHVQQILPPSLAGSEDVWVRYFVKAVVQRPSKLSLNYRSYAPFLFLPIDRPRADEGASTAFFVKRQHTLSILDDAKRPRGLLGAFQEPKKRMSDTIAIEIRQPNPPTVVPGVPANIELLGYIETNFNDLSDLRITHISVYFLATTRIKAQNLKRTLGGRLPVYATDLNIPFKRASGPTVPACHVHMARLPTPLIVATDCAPTFVTCNISRTYEFEFNITVQHGPSKATIQLISPIEVLSGVSAPPPQERGDAVVAEGEGPPPALPIRPQVKRIVSADGQQGEESLPSYEEVSQIGQGPSARPANLGSSRALRHRRTTYGVADSYFEHPERYD
ncbi:hypothetical protein BCR37DRAFT_383811 [Protomyces lactucae-debilis]|uniref:Arrestin-like N-terminal domain-containing protein n=1 Tax=Protomyces lactucae-debilis TaxID=2754530 RepID=A0A1Y2EW57_PROLT|nr:uncharacterized protein BCR37DRAFT_383811 [Protomyces lactucae-debilis]ORY75737.1 hypothetical protein BCR37DRAFT_383811 [Protomyces lactucae-debilis]